MRFSQGQEVICKNPDGWGLTRNSPLFRVAKFMAGPKKDEIVTVDGYPENLQDHVFLKEYDISVGDQGRAAYDENWFEPVLPQIDLERLMEEVQARATMKLREYFFMAKEFFAWY